MKTLYKYIAIMANEGARTLEKKKVCAKKKRREETKKEDATLLTLASLIKVPHRDVLEHR